MAEATRGLEGRTILIPRGGAWGERVRRECAERGATGVVAPLITAKPPRDVGALDDYLDRLSAGEYAWLFVTSAATVEVLASRHVELPESTQVAVVGSATAKALHEAGYPVSFTPKGPASARSLVAQWRPEHPPVPGARYLIMRSDLAMATISDDLYTAGYDVDVCIAYRTVGVDLDADVRDRLAAGEFDAVLLTSLSVGRELHAQVPDLPSSTVLASIGPGTTREAERLGLHATVTSPVQTVEAMLDSLGEHFAATGGKHP